MKLCPQCNSHYENSALLYCTKDGKPLMASSETKEAITIKLSPPVKKSNISKKIIAALILIGFVALAAIMLPLLQSTLNPATSTAYIGQPDKSGEPSLLIDKANISLDLTKHWRELTERERKESKASKATLRADLVLRRLNSNTQFGRRLGTTARFKPEWRSTHTIEAQEDSRKCSPEVQHSYLLNFNIENEGIDIPFDLSYEIDYWNAHNGLKGDWQAVYIGHPTEQLTIKISFPKNKPYTDFGLKSLDGKDCNAKAEPYINPIYEEGVDKETGAKTITWTIDSPKLHWVYRIDWKW